MKKILADFKAEFSIGRILFLLVAVVLIVPLLLMLLRKVPGVGMAIDKAQAATAALIVTALLGLSMGDANAATLGTLPASQAVVYSVDHAAPPLVFAAATPDAFASHFAIGTCALIASAVFTLIWLRSRRAATMFGLSTFVALAILSVTAADTSSLLSQVTRWVIRQGSGSDSLTNSLSVYDVSDTNRSGINSNAAFFVVTSNTMFEGKSAVMVLSNGVGGVRFLRFDKGILTSTNG